MDTPFGFDVELDPGLFTLEALDALYRRGAAQGKAGAQDADPGFERKEDPPLIPLERPLAEELAARKLHVWFSDVPEWAPEYGAARDKVLDCRRDRPLAAALPPRREHPHLLAGRPGRAPCRPGDADQRRRRWPQRLALLVAERAVAGGAREPAPRRALPPLARARDLEDVRPCARATRAPRLRVGRTGSSIPAPILP